jgi:hypothetical protein
MGRQGIAVRWALIGCRSFFALEASDSSSIPTSDSSSIPTKVTRANRPMCMCVGVALSPSSGFVRASSWGFSARTLHRIAKLVEVNRLVIERAWDEHFG